MATTDKTAAATAGTAERWYALSAEDVAGRFGVDSASGLSVAKAAELLQKEGPNALPEEKGEPGWRRFVDQYRAYMQIILLIAAAISLVIGQWSTGLVLIALTVFNAVTGLRQEGKAESAMNALKSLMKQTARVRRDGAEAEIPAEEVVPGDVVMLEARPVPGLHADHPAHRRRDLAGHRPVEHGPRADRAHGVQRRDRPAPGGQGRERDERAQVADEADRARAP